MAEKYGEIPPRFTKKWWEHFWEYYRWHVIITAVAVLIAIVTIIQCSSRVKYDLVMVYAGHGDMSETSQDKLRSLAMDYTDDIDGNEQIVVDLKTMVFTDLIGNRDYDYAIQTKLDLTFTDDYTYIYLMDETEALVYMNRKDTASAFENTDVFAEGTDAEILHTTEENIGYAVCLDGSRLLKENGINADGLYLLVRADNKHNEKNAISHESALKFAKALIEQ